MFCRKSLVVAAAAVCLSSAAAPADVPRSINVQGRLTDTSGAPVAEGAKTFTFYIFDAEAGGVEIWPGDGQGESQVIATDANGVWNALVGANVTLTEAVFQDTSRWLEVTIDDGVSPPETLPRIKLNTNPYTFRAASAQKSDTAQYAAIARNADTAQHSLKADSAGYAETARHADSAGHADSLGGLPGSEYVHRSGDAMYGPLETPELNVGNSGLTGDLSVWANGAGTPVVRAGHFAGEGGYLSLYDETGTNSTIELAPDADGTGGFLGVAGGGNGYFFVDGNANGGTSDPQVWIAGASSYTLFDANQIANGSVQMSADAISAPEILDEPGVAAGARNDVPGVAVLTTIATATATFPARGFAVVICEATFRTLTANIYITARLYDNGVEQAFWFWEAGDVDNFFDLRQTYVFTDSVLGGPPNTYELRVDPSAGSVDVVHAKVTVMYFPTNYGAVFSPVAVTGERDASLSAIGGQQVVAGAPPDVEAERAASIAANQARIDREMAETRAEIEELKKQLSRSNQFLNAQREEK
jgi:hypothetical protein